MDTYITDKLNMHKIKKHMIYNTACKIVITLTILLFTLSNASGNDLYCVSLKGFKISSKYRHRVLSFGFKATNAEIYGLLHKPLGWFFDIHNGKNWSGSFGGCVYVYAGGTTLDYFYDDFVVIKKKPGTKLNKIKMELSLDIDEDPVEETAEDYDPEKKYELTNKNLDIHRCKKRQF
jgi:hypothetical protein